MTAIKTTDPETSAGMYLLARLCEGLEARGAVVWLDAGSCLRAVRNGVPWSTDVDLGLWRTDLEYALEVVDELRAEGFRITYQGGMPYVDDMITIHPPADSTLPFTNIDLIFYRAQGDEAVKINSGMPLFRQPLARLLRRLLMKTGRRQRGDSTSLMARVWHGVPLWVRRWVWRVQFFFYHRYYRTFWAVVPKHYFESLRPIDLAGRRFVVPERAEDYLAYRYGEDWRVPAKGWKFTTSPVVRLRPIRSVPAQEILRRPRPSDRVVRHKAVAPRNDFEPSREEVQLLLARNKS